MAEKNRAKIKSVKYWLRWLGVLPGSLGASIIGIFLLHWILFNTLSNFIEPYPELPERTLTPFVVSLVFVWAGSRVAPEYGFETSIVLFGLLLFITGGLFFLSIGGSTIWGQRLYLANSGLGVATFIVGAFIGLYAARRNGTRTPSK